MLHGRNRTGPAWRVAAKTTASVAVDPSAGDRFGEPRPAPTDPAVSAPRADRPAGGQRRLRTWLSGLRAVPRVARPVLPEGAVIGPPVELPTDDPLAGYLMDVAAAVDVRDLHFESPILKGLKDAGVVLIVPLISAGAPLGMLSFGPRLSGADYSTDDRRLLTALARRAAPAIRVGQLVREQQAEALRRERIDQQLEVARLIQRQFLPESLPDLPCWQVTAFYRPAQTVGGDFYDFIPLPGGQVMVVIGDVTDKGVPAALVMASAHALLRAAAPRLISPGAVLETVNDLLWRDTPAHMFVTCLALVLDAATGQITFANAGHDVPYVRTADGVAELRAKGMPLGLMAGMTYEEKAFTFRPGDCALLHSDGLSEAHAADREMFGFHRVAALVGRGASGQALIDLCLTELDTFTGTGHEQEDDITLLSLERTVPVARTGSSR
jgi:serine phosphatase RsbU (regulator of sigma subunit)